MKNGNKERGRKLGCVPGSISPLLSSPSWAATFSHLCNIINEKAFQMWWRTWLRVQTVTDTSWHCQAMRAEVRINWMSLSCTKNRLFYVLTLLCSNRISMFLHSWVGEIQKIEFQMGYLSHLLKCLAVAEKHNCYFTGTFRNSLSGKCSKYFCCWSERTWLIWLVDVRAGF